MTRAAIGLFALFAAAAVLLGQEADVVVVGATPAGVSAAVNAAREGMTVLLLEETGHIGGLASGGLSNSDFHSFASIGGTFREFMHRVERHYAETYGASSQQVRDCVKGGYYEPRVARRVFERMIAEQKSLRMLLHHRLLSASTEQSSRRTSLRAATFRDLRTGRELRVQGRVFIDATYEGDLAALAGAPYRLGSESRSEFGESLAPEEPNRFVQTYNFRVCLSRVKENSLPLPRPKTYCREAFTKLLVAFREKRVLSLANPGPRPVLKVRPIPNGKADFNDDATAPMSLALKNINQPWTEGSPEVRARIFQQYKDYSLSLFWFLANDPEVPDNIRSGMRQWGLPKDEYPDTDHWSPALYVREGRRIIGEYVFRQQDTQQAPGSLRAPLQRDSIAIGDYSLNSHGVSAGRDGIVSGRIGAPIQPYQIPYGVIVPRQVDWLLVPVALSATHVGYSALRMEPTWTALGQAAGIAAAQAVVRRLEPRAIDVAHLQHRLHQLGAMTIYISDLACETEAPRPSWDPPGVIRFRLNAFPPQPPYFLSAQYFGNLGLFHESLEPSPGGSGPRQRLTGQWGTEFPGHAVGFKLPIDPDLARRWLARAKLAPSETSNPGERITRGDFLRRMYAAIAPARDASHTKR